MQSIEITYLTVALTIWLLGYFHNGKFVRPKWKIPGKLLFYLGITFLLVNWVGHWALFFIIGHPLIGLIFHINVCRKNNINWKTCQPREKYLNLQEKWAKGDFSNRS